MHEKHVWERDVCLRGGKYRYECDGEKGKQIYGCGNQKMRGRKEYQMERNYNKLTSFFVLILNIDSKGDTEAKRTYPLLPGCSVIGPNHSDNGMYYTFRIAFPTEYTKKSSIVSFDEVCPDQCNFMISKCYWLYPIA